MSVMYEFACGRVFGVKVDRPLTGREEEVKHLIERGHDDKEPRDKKKMR